MRLVKLTTDVIKRTVGLATALFIFTNINAQENSPYSRYGMGDIVPSQNIALRGMGGIGAGYSFDLSIPAVTVPSLNISNPASLGSLNSRGYTNVIFDVGGEIVRRTLKSNTSPAKYSSTNTNISYVQVGFPIAPKRWEAKGVSWGLSFGLKPVTRINYKIENGQRTSIDSILTTYEGSGGISQANISTGIKIKRLSLGVTGGYSFGNKDFATRVEIMNDSLLFYKSNTQSQSTFNGLFFTLGAQYEIKMKKGSLQLGAYSNLQQTLKAKRDNLEETFAYDGSGGTVTIDTIRFSSGVAGNLEMPASYTFGFIYNNSNWMFGADLGLTQWNDYRFYDQKDFVQNNWSFRAGAQYYPAKENTPVNKYWRFVKYRAGMYFGRDYIKFGESRNEYGITLGAGLPLTNFNLLRRGDFVTLNTGFEFGARGDKNSFSLRENISRITIGVSMNARWFQKPKYD